MKGYSNFPLGDLKYEMFNTRLLNDYDKKDLELVKKLYFELFEKLYFKLFEAYYSGDEKRKKSATEIAKRQEKEYGFPFIQSFEETHQKMVDYFEKSEGYKKVTEESDYIRRINTETGAYTTKHCYFDSEKGKDSFKSCPVNASQINFISRVVYPGSDDPNIQINKTALDSLERLGRKIA